MPTNPPPEDQLEAEDIVVTGSRTAPLTIGSPAPLPSYLTIARPIPTPTRPEPELEVIIVDFEWGFLGIKTIVVETKEGPVKIKIDKGNMSDAQFGALIKSFRTLKTPLSFEKRWKRLLR
jgi:hypothetical protein